MSPVGQPIEGPERRLGRETPVNSGVRRDHVLSSITHLRLRSGIAS